MPSPREQPPLRNPNNRRRRPEVMPGGWLWLVILVLLVGILYLTLGFGNANSIESSDFYTLLDKNAIDSIQYTAKDAPTWQVYGELKKNIDLEQFLPRADPAVLKKLSGGKFTVTVNAKEFTERLKTVPGPAAGGPHVKVEQETGGWIGPILMFLVPGLILLAIFFLFLVPRFRDPMGGGFLSNYIKSPAKRYERNKARVTFDDVADMASAKGELQEVVEYLRSPEKFQRLGAQIPKGVLLVGPPGTGKTLLARAVAGEAGVPFFSISGSEFIQMFVGVGASRVRDLFKTAKENAPCLVFVDEIDAVGRMRGAGVGGGSDEREQTLNQILSEMDGFQPNESVIVLAATNRPDVLDSALLRPGRFDRHVTIDRPTWQGRMDILKVHTRNKPLADDVNLEEIARKMVGMTGADLRNLANEAALLATRENKARIDRADFEHASDRVIMGPKREELITPEGRRKTANHEAGHALVSWLEPEADPPQKVSIIPRGRALGVTFNVPDEERYHHGLDYFKARLLVLMGGRAADRLVFGQPFSGHENDLKEATRLARYMVTHWGMSDKLGPMAFRIGEEHVFLGKEIQEPRDFSEETMAVIDEEVKKILLEADQGAYDLLEKHRDDLERLVEALLQKEELYREEIEKILGKVPRSLVDGKPPTNEAVFAPGGIK